MAKLKGPLFSLGATQQLGKALVYFPWKGLNIVREYVVPSNPQTALQITQRGYLTTAVAQVHDMQAYAAFPLGEVDTMAYAQWASVVKTATTWFNQAVKNYIDQLVAGLLGMVFGGGLSTPGVGTLLIEVREHLFTTTAGIFYYGTSPTALIHAQAATVVTNRKFTTLAGLTAGVKYYWQFRPTVPIGYLGVMSGIYYGYPT